MFESDRPVLRQTFFGNIAIGQNFQTCHNAEIVACGIFGIFFLDLKAAIHTKAHPGHTAERLDMNI